MNAPRTSPFEADLVDVPRALHVAMVYENISSALHATEMLDPLLRRGCNGAQPRVTSCSFATASTSAPGGGTPPYAAPVDLIVVAASGAMRDLPGDVERWLRNLMAEARADCTAIAAYYRQDRTPDELDSPRVQALQQIAEESGCRFLTLDLVEELASALA